VSDKTIALAALRKRTAKGGLLPVEATLAGSLLKSAVRTLDIKRFIDALSVYPRAVTIAVENMSIRRPEDVFEMPKGVIKRICDDNWTDPKYKDIITCAVVIFLIAIVCSGCADRVDDFRRRVQAMDGLHACLKPIFDVVTSASASSDDPIYIVAGLSGKMMQLDYSFDADDAFLATVYITQLLSGHVLGEEAARPVLEYFSVVWRDLVLNRSFLIRSPAMSGPLILEKMNDGRTNLAKLANLVLAAESAVRKKLSNDLREKIWRITEKRRTPLDELKASIA
jgi:hypothetical protein